MGLGFCHFTTSYTGPYANSADPVQLCNGSLFMVVSDQGLQCFLLRISMQDTVNVKNIHQKVKLQMN